MVNISPDELALELLNQCLRGNSHSRELLEALVRMATGNDAAVARGASQALFRTLVERLADEFEPCLCDSYASLFADVLDAALPVCADDVLERYRRIRAPRPFAGNAAEIRGVFVLSRVTLGADVAITSIFIDAAKRRFPNAAIHFTGPRKNYELFAADARVHHVDIPYPREGTLERRLENYFPLMAVLDEPHTIVIDPDSRLTQLGLLPVGEDENYYFFESRSYGGYGDESLVNLATRWAGEILGITGAKAYIAPAQTPDAAGITVSLGVGENHAKRIGDDFERELMIELAKTGASILVDRGGSEEESGRVDRAIEGLTNVRAFTGSFAAFAAAIRGSKLYCGYDSAGQHVAAACGVPLLTIFAGYISERMFYRWRPDGPGPKEVICVDSQNGAEIIARCRRALERLRDGR